VKRDDEVACFLARLLDGIDYDDVRAGHGFVIKFALVRMVSANRVDVDTRGQIRAAQDGCEAVVAVDTMSAPRAASPGEADGSTGIPSRSDISLQNFSRLAASRP